MQNDEPDWIEWVTSEKSKLPMAEPNMLLFSQIRREIARKETVSPAWLYIAIFSLLLLAVINIRSVMSYAAIHMPQQETPGEMLAQNNSFY